jgi:hypothetical protein
MIDESFNIPKEITGLTLQKYQEIAFTINMIKPLPDKISYHSLFYGINEDFELEWVNKSFDKYITIMRFLRYDKDDYFIFRIIKSNVNEEVSFEEEKEYLMNFIKSKIENKKT